MGKGNKLNDKFKTIYQREKNLNSFLREDDIQILENINRIFINNIKINFSNLLQKDINVISYNMKILSNHVLKNSKNFMYFNLIEILPSQNQSLIMFPSNFLSIITDMLFGGTSNFIDKKDQQTDITSTEYCINKKIIALIIKLYSCACEKFFSINMKFISIKTLLEFKKSNFNDHTTFLISCFDLKISCIKTCFCILIPLSIIKKINKKIVIAPHQKTNLEKDISNNTSLNDIHNIKLNIIIKLINISISYNQIRNLSVGDVLLIEKPDKIIGYIENKPVFFGYYRSFNKRSIVLIEEFINKNIDPELNKEYSNE